MPTKDWGVNMEGALVATISGFAICWGYGMVTEPDENSTKTLKRAQGGAMLMMGLYLWAPTWLRNFWRYNGH